MQKICEHNNYGCIHADSIVITARATFINQACITLATIPGKNQTEHNIMDMIFIEELTVATIIGIHNWEQNIRQKLVLDIAIACDSRKAAASDNIKDCLSYSDISEAIIQHIELNSFALVERVAEEISEIILRLSNAPWVRIKVSKPNAVVYASRVGVIIERGIRPE